MKSIQALIIITMYGSVLAAIVLAFLQSAKPLLGYLHLSNENNGSLAFLFLVISCVSYAVISFWAYMNIKADQTTSEQKRQVYTHLLLKPFNGPVIYYLGCYGQAIKQYLVNPKVIIVLYQTRNVAVFAFLFSLLLVATLQATVFMICYIIALLISIVTSLLFELSILTDIMTKHDDDLYA